MATVAAPRPAAGGAYDRIFYSGMAIAMALTVFVGFAPTYYLRLFTAEGPTVTVGGSPFTSILHVHGALFSAWVLLFLVQTALVASHRVRVHQKLGMAGAGLAGLMLVVGVMTAIAGARNAVAPPGIDPLAFLAIPLFDMLLFAIFVGTALWLRRNKEAHKRLMLLGYMSILVAAVARWPGVLPLGPPAFFGLTLLFLAAGIAYDLATRRRVHPVYLWGGALFVLSVPARLLLSGTQAWRSFAVFLTG